MEEEASKKQKRWRLRGGYRRLLSRRYSPSKTKEIKQEEDGKDEAERVRKGSKEIDAHPVIRILEAPSKKATSRPEFLRYLEYLKEGGTWEPNSERPSIYFK
ncbi:uncharacterized protein LOC122015430 [Zingiber officinale]|uniref:Uncharacterized protein n=1 Tax=Zingiber officinale TaxID=94328 RepID=A0A8J5KGT6_ZINOF|nr:uncharacterized protein LOC122015430 [Zingiber officinale]KAG6480679.1 hypothetical protein ZIOFF_057264 [Zingiber officinale]